MAFTSEIDKLERRWNENPLGLTFAPYAEACRKAGDVAKALELLEKGLAQHPNYVPAHIVRGRCYLDIQSDADAEQAFLRAVELDPENVIALKSLAELAERGGRLPEAIRRLEQLLEVDRSNEEARGQLDRVLELPAVPAAAPAPGADSAAVPVANEDSAPALATLDPVADEPAAATTGATDGVESHDDPSLIELPPFEPEHDDSPGRNEWQVANDSEAIRASEHQMGDIVLGADPPDYAHEAPGEPAEADLLEPPPFASLVTEVEQPMMDLLPPPPVLAEEESVPLPPEPEPVESAVLEPEPEPEPEVEPEREPEPEPVAAAMPTAEPGSAPEPEPAAAPEPEPVHEPELVVTASMAEVFLRQGYPELARAVYVQLAERDPSDTRIAAALAELQPEPASPPPPPAPELRFDATSTGGRSVQQLFSAILSASRPASSATVHPPAFEAQRRPTGEPTRPAQESLSLSAVFGEESAPAGSSSGSAPAANGEPSFDEFYAAQGGSSAESELPKGPASAPSSAPASTPEDLEQFNAWLRGLKR